MYEDSNATKDRRVGCLTSFEMSSVYQDRAWGNKFNREREANGVQPHASFHSRDISGKREVRPSQRPVIISLHRHTCPNEDTQEAICIPYLLIVG
ncbi:hypothetical protein N7455_005749 [Penicillium solitum]|uniref:uncharacterized protein n=1 Tax=Penicillium solitum TaxID=60172 RepID=UPI0017F07D7C|nr:hypothetical protein HAV15_010276 [Penicillium sp. str. \